MPPDAAKSRLTYIDWMRGLACLLMFQTHCYDSWLGGAARQSRFLMYSQLGGTFPAPLFLFLAGISFALVTEKLRRKNLPPAQIARTTLRRGAEIFAFGLLFRLQEYLIAWGWAPKSDLLRVDILNTIGLSMMLMAVVCWIATCIADKSCHSERSASIPNQSCHSERSEEPAFLDSATKAGAPFLARSLREKWGFSPTVILVLAALGTSLTISLLTPLLWTTWRPRFLPWPLESYINGVHNLGTPQPWLFPIFPWTAFAFAGLAVGFLLQSAWAKSREAASFLALGAAGIVLVELARFLDALPRQLYPVYDYWHTSPNFFLIRLGMLLMILAAAYAWCRWVIGNWIIGSWVIGKWPRPVRGFSPLIQLGQASLLVYWVHIEFVYGRLSILPKRAQGIRTASVGLLVIFLAMLALAYIRTHFKEWARTDSSRLKPKLSS